MCSVSFNSQLNPFSSGFNSVLDSSWFNLQSVLDSTLVLRSVTYSVLGSGRGCLVQFGFLFNSGFGLGSWDFGLVQGLVLLFVLMLLDVRLNSYGYVGMVIPQLCGTSIRH